MTVNIDAPEANALLLIRRAAPEVFAAFADPEVTTKFWFTHSTGPLEAGAKLQWRWEMYDLTIPVHVLTVEPDRSIELDWGAGADETRLRLTFEPHGDGHTVVRVNHRGFSGTPEEKLAKVIDSTGGFHLVLAALKAWLEHGVALGVVLDSHPPPAG